MLVSSVLFVPLAWQSLGNRMSDSHLMTTWNPESAGPTRGPGQGGGDSGDRGIGTGIVTKTRAKTKKPSLYKVLILNDDYTPMEFVVHVLERFFGKPREEAVQIMLHVHRHGVGICGVYTFEVAETKVAQVIELARRHQHPLQCTMEKE
jgi:ATP-dependent Clp protease adaptor protein ClpS